MNMPEFLLELQWVLPNSELLRLANAFPNSAVAREEQVAVIADEPAEDQPEEKYTAFDDLIDSTEVQVLCVRFVFDSVTGYTVRDPGQYPAYEEEEEDEEPAPGADGEMGERPTPQSHRSVACL